MGDKGQFFLTESNEYCKKKGNRKITVGKHYHNNNYTQDSQEDAKISGENVR
jgi:hypothetical protein